jgi:hypothetical protein
MEKIDDRHLQQPTNSSGEVRRLLLFSHARKQILGFSGFTIISYSYDV